VHGLGHRGPGYAPPAEASLAGLEVISSIVVWMNRIFSSTGFEWREVRCGVDHATL
jgi:hypothetical protein